MPESKETLLNICRSLRYTIIKTSAKNRSAHLASSLSIVDILTVLYWQVLNIKADDPLNQDRDRFILSKGHACIALYSVLAARGFFDPALLDSVEQAGCSLEGHPSIQCVPGVEASTGALGHGICMGVGLALGAKIKKAGYRVFTLLGDGECNEGTVWEAAMFSAAHTLDNLVAIVDFNKWQATGRSLETLKIDPLIDKWKAFGWNAMEIDGHDLDQLSTAFASLKPGGKPTVFIAHTVKGKGVSFMEDDNNWHYRIPNEEELARAKEELKQ